MATVDAVKGAAPAQARKTDLLKLKVFENDPKFDAEVTPFGMRLSGKATNNGIIASTFEVQFDGKKVRFGLSSGDTSQHVFSKLKKALPKGYEARVLQTYKNMPPELVIGIAKTGSASKVPTLKELKKAFDTWEKVSTQIPWKTKKPAGAVLQSVVIEKAPEFGPGYQITAHVLKSDPTKVYFESNGSLGKRKPGGPIVNPPPGGFVPKYFGPVSVNDLPKGKQ